MTPTCYVFSKAEWDYVVQSIGYLFLIVWIAQWLLTTDPWWYYDRYRRYRRARRIRAIRARKASLQA